MANEVTFNATITNRSRSPATGLLVIDRFDPGLKTCHFSRIQLNMTCHLQPGPIARDYD